MIMCHSCSSDDGINRKGNLNICKKCWSPKSGLLINKTRAMKEYALPESQLYSLRYALKKNSYGNNDIILFLLSDVKNKAIAFYGSLEEAEKEVKKRSDKREFNKQRKQQLQNDRRAELNQYLISRGLGPIRSDSYICAQYVEKGDASGYTIIEIGEIMEEMNFYYRHTNYKKLLSKCYDEFKMYCGYDPDIHDIVRDEAKEKALREYVKIHIHNQKNIMDIVPKSLHETLLFYYQH